MFSQKKYFEFSAIFQQRNKNETQKFKILLCFLIFVNIMRITWYDAYVFWILRRNRATASRAFYSIALSMCNSIDIINLHLFFLMSIIIIQCFNYLFSIFVALLLLHTPRTTIAYFNNFLSSVSKSYLEYWKMWWIGSITRNDMPSCAGWTVLQKISCGACVDICFLGMKINTMLHP